MTAVLLAASGLYGPAHQAHVTNPAPLAMPVLASAWSPAPAHTNPASITPAPTIPAPNAFAPVASAARDRHGRFTFPGTINGRALDLLVDTGADIVAIPAEQAASLGIPVAPDQFRPILRSASGPANGAPVRIATLSVAGQDLADVDAVVIEGLDRVLLGQSALRRLGKVMIDGDRMEIGGH